MSSDYFYPEIVGADLNDTGFGSVRGGSNRAEIQIMGEHNVVLSRAYFMISMSVAFAAPIDHQCAA